MEAKILGVGNALVDVLVRRPSDDMLSEFGLPKGSMQLTDEKQQSEVYERVKDMKPQIVCGGSAANTICGLSKLGMNTGLIGKIGPNDLGKLYKSDLEANGVHSHLLGSETHTGSCISLITPDSERTMVTCLGAAAELAESDIDESVFDGYTHLYVEGYLVQNPGLIEKLYDIAKKKGMRTMIDLASYNVVEANIEFLQHLIGKYVDVVFANEEEATAFTAAEDVDALNMMNEYADCVVLKQGRRGSLVKVGDEIVRVGIVNANSIDTTGAGDLYAAGFIYGQAQGYSAQKCAEIGAVTSGNVIEIVGTKMDAQRWANIRSQIKHITQ